MTTECTANPRKLGPHSGPVVEIGLCAAHLASFEDAKEDADWTCGGCAEPVCVCATFYQEGPKVPVSHESCKREIAMLKRAILDLGESKRDTESKLAYLQREDAFTVSEYHRLCALLEKNGIDPDGDA